VTDAVCCALCFLPSLLSGDSHAFSKAAISASSRVEEEGYPGSLVPKRPRPKPFAEQPVGAGMRSTAPIRKGRGRPRKHRGADELALAEPAGAAE
jgi:hypothetical protein